MTNATDLFALYVAERRTYSIDGFVCERLPTLTRYTPLRPEFEGIVLFATLAAAEADAVISDQISHFGELGRPFEWKVHEFDQPADLAARLRERGFVPGVTEAFMLYPLAGHDGPRRAGGVEIKIKRLQSARAIRAIVDLQEKIWTDSLPWLEANLTTAQDRLEIYGAYAGEVLVGSGWIEFPPDSTIAALHGGAVLPAYRGRGVYSALFAARAASAKARGTEWLAVDAAPMSRPILLRKGFRFVCETTPFRFAAPTGRAGASGRSIA